MNDQVKAIILSSLLIFLAIIIQSTILEFISIGGAKPDLALMILVFISLRKGKTVGQVSGFIGGLIQDFLSLPYPVGFYSLIRSATGFFFGLFKGRVFIGPILMPVILVLVATIFKFLMATIVTFIFSFVLEKTNFFSFRLLFEILYNCLLAPPMFAFVNVFRTFKLNDKEKF